MIKVAVVILNYNGEKFLQTFLSSIVDTQVRSATLYTEVIIADNASTDQSINYLHTHFPDLQIISLEKNLGFAGGYNAALQQISNQYDYYVLLNSDVEISEKWIQPIIDLMESSQKIAVCQPKIRSFHRKNYFEYAGAAGGYIDWLGYPFCRGRIFDTCEEDLGQYDDTKEIFWATGACLFIRSKVFHEMGGFDELFFAHMEEIDLCWRIKNAGYQVFYCSSSVVYHVGGGTLPQSNPHKTFLNYRNGLAMLYKNLPTNKLISTLFIRLILDGISSIKFLLAGSLANIWAIIKAHFAFYSMIPKLTRHSPKNVDLIYQKSIVWQYFVRKKKPQL